MSAAAPAPVATPGDLEREIKYVLPAARMPFAEQWVSAVCRAGSHYPAGDVWTVYYDTAGQCALREKLDSDYLKTKVRVRWYTGTGGHAHGDAFVEVKRRVGDRREKIRVRLPATAASFARLDLEATIWLDVLQLLRPVGFSLADAWRPVVALAYRRLRRVVASGARVNCDSTIRAVAVARRRGRAAFHPGPLDVGVVEVKGPSEELPVQLAGLARLGGRAASFSKYAAVWAHLAPRGA
jgi:hypothetical protein